MSKPQNPETHSPSLTLKRRLSAPADKVFAAWTDPEKIVRWFGPAETIDGSVWADMDVRVGGRYRMRFKTGDGESHEVGGVYQEVVRNERLVFSWAWHSTPERESLVTITLKADGHGTMLTLHQERFFDEKARDGHQRGWTGTLEKLARYLS
jgi:uncharacterized protein YndB with AHSA1/START domain